MSDNRIYLCRYEAPCGTLELAATHEALLMCDWCGTERHVGILKRITDGRFVEYSTNGILGEAIRLLDGYFTDKIDISHSLLLEPAGTDFRQKVWTELMKIPYGQTVTYGELSRRLGKPSAVRAVANACGANPLSIFIPCHRVVGAGGKLTGYAGGLAAKRFLLELEKMNFVPKD